VVWWCGDLVSQEVKGLIQAFEASGIREEDANVMVRMQYSDAMTSIQSASPGWLLKYEASSWAQLKVLAARQLRNSVRHPVLITLNLGATGEQPPNPTCDRNKVHHR
jgi:hypothetical protein